MDESVDLNLLIISYKFRIFKIILIWKSIYLKYILYLYIKKYINVRLFKLNKIDFS